ncbi:uncharacterized protein [Palaemon carinicauda]|uniref:uncharacterized protein n=1 Tax=Palaemon carinicauda TaxID=392227 RepID=UPI0035B69940
MRPKSHNKMEEEEVTNKDISVLGFLFSVVDVLPVITPPSASPSSYTNLELFCHIKWELFCQIKWELFCQIKWELFCQIKWELFWQIKWELFCQIKWELFSGNYSGCVFPSWVTNHRRWHALDKGASYSVSRHNTTLRLHHAHNQRVQSATMEQMQSYNEDGEQVTRPSYLGTEERLVCSETKEVSPSRVVLVVHSTTGCSSGYVCTVFYKRDGHIIEMQQGNRAIRAQDACRPLYFNDTKAPHITLTSGAPSRRQCPFVGVWVAGEGDCRRDVTHLRAGCVSLYNLHFVHACPDETTKHAFVCHGHWAEAGSIFVVASPDDRPSHRLCLIATSISNKDKQLNHPNNNTQMLQVTAHAHSCQRHHVPPTTTLSLNLTAQGECSVPGISNGMRPVTPPLLMTLIILVSSVTAYEWEICR